MEKNLKKKARVVAKTNNSIPAFLLKTYEILDVMHWWDFAINVLLRVEHSVRRHNFLECRWLCIFRQKYQWFLRESAPEVLQA